MIQFLTPVNQTSSPHTPRDTSTDHWWGSFTLIAFACLVLALPALWYVPTYAYSYYQSPEQVPEGIPVEFEESSGNPPNKSSTEDVINSQTEQRPLLVLSLGKTLADSSHAQI